MIIRKKFISYFILIFILVLAAAAYSLSHGYVIKNYLSQIKPALEETNRNSKLETNAQLIRYDDEVLTQSARNYAFTGEESWKKRYYQYVPLLDKRIAEAKNLGNEIETEFFKKIEQANTELIKLEEQSFALVEKGDLAGAQNNLDSEEYLAQKEVYKNALEQYLKTRGLEFDEASNISTETFNKIVERSSLYSLLEDIILTVIIILIIITLFLLYNLLNKRMFIPLFMFKNAVKEITGGKYGQTVETKTNDEVADFAKDFNKMSQELKESREGVEAKVKERTEELEKLNKFMTGREIKMIELKDKIKELEEKNENQK